MYDYRGNERNVLKYERDNRKPSTEEGFTMQWTKDKWPNNDLQNITQKTKDRATRTH